MKYILILCIIFSAIFSTYPDPPFSEVQTNNLDKSSSFFGVYLSQNKTNLLVFNTTLAWIDSRIIEVSPSVGNHISANSNNNLIWVYGEAHSNSLSPLDYDNDGCDESATFNNITIQKQISLTFRNNTVIQNDPSNPFELPSSLQLNQTEYDTLQLNLTVTALYNYTVLDKNPTPIGGNSSGTFCDGEPQKQNFAAISKYNSNYTVEGGSVSFLLKTPILKEQWHKNNRFDNLVFTKRSLYNAKISINGNPIAYIPMYEPRMNLVSSRYLPLET
ncbi:hypothetical protein HYT84_04995 [Candidatus Micrarchaeota archaeon]|nr:hypothetical protein [Candidatus Micrarchaeota archaeon]